jgi:hypothetical protein
MTKTRVLGNGDAGTEPQFAVPFLPALQRVFPDEDDATIVMI